jgi:hypothetical protein
VARGPDCVAARPGRAGPGLAGSSPGPAVRRRSPATSSARAPQRVGVRRLGRRWAGSARPPGSPPPVVGQPGLGSHAAGSTATATHCCARARSGRQPRSAGAGVHALRGPGTTMPAGRRPWTRQWPVNSGRGRLPMTGNEVGGGRPGRVLPQRHLSSSPGDQDRLDGAPALLGLDVADRHGRVSGRQLAHQDPVGGQTPGRRAGCRGRRRGCRPGTRTPRTDVGPGGGRPRSPPLVEPPDDH